MCAREERGVMLRLIPTGENKGTPVPVRDGAHWIGCVSRSFRRKRKLRDAKFERTRSRRTSRRQSTLTAVEDMFWILRRTRLTSAAALLNSINNNNSSDSRPARKDYNKLSGEEQNARNKTADHLDNEPVCREGFTTGNEPLDTDTDSSFTDLELDDRDEFSDDSDYEEALTCNVCDRSFACPKQLSSHKQKKRHFGCSACDSLFPSLMSLEHHKEEFEHWSGDEEDLCTDSEDDDETVITEERERLL